MHNGEAGALNGVAAKQYVPQNYGVYTGALAYDVTARAGCVARLSFKGKTQITVPNPSQPVSPDNVATIKGVLNPTITVTHPDGSKSSKMVTGEYFDLPSGAVDVFDGVQITRHINKTVWTGTEKYSGFILNETLFRLGTQDVGAQYNTRNFVSTHLRPGAMEPYTGFLANSIYADLPFRTRDECINWIKAESASGTPIAVCYQLAKPITTCFTADVPLKPGVNHISVIDTNGVLQEATVEIIADASQKLPWARNARVAGCLEKPVHINGIPFDGSNDIVLNEAISGLLPINGFTTQLRYQVNPQNAWSINVLDDLQNKFMLKHGVMYIAGNDGNPQRGLSRQMLLTPDEYGNGYYRVELSRDANDRLQQGRITVIGASPDASGFGLTLTNGVASKSSYSGHVYIVDVIVVPQWETIDQLATTESIDLTLLNGWIGHAFCTMVGGQMFFTGEVSNPSSFDTDSVIFYFPKTSRMISFSVLHANGGEGYPGYIAETRLLIAGGYKHYPGGAQLNFNFSVPIL